MTVAYFNGEFVPLDEVKISPLDRGYLFGDGVFEVIPCYQKHLFRPQQHIQRLLRSLSAIYLPTPYSAEQWHELLQKVVEQNCAANQTIYLQISRGVQEKRDHTFDEFLTPTVLIMSTPMNKPDMASLEQEAGIHCVSAKDDRWQHCDVKCTSLLANVLLRHQATLQQAQETILIRDGQVTEGASSNVFLVFNQSLITPPLSQFLLGGITRDLILELAKKNAINVKAQPINQQQLLEADEIWITSSSLGIRPVVKFDNLPVGHGLPGPLWRTIATEYIEYRHTLMG